MPNPAISRAFKRTLVESLLTDDYHLILIDHQPETQNFTGGDIAANVITLTGHTFVNGTRVQLFVLTGAAPTGLETLTDYFIVNAATDEVQLATSVGGTPLTISGGGSLALVEQDLEINNSRVPLAQLVKYEVARVAVDFTAATLQDRQFGGVQATYTNVEVTAGDPLFFTHYALLRGSGNTAEDVTGELFMIRAMPSSQGLNTGQVITIPIRFALIQKTAGSTEDT